MTYDAGRPIEFEDFDIAALLNHCSRTVYDHNVAAGWYTDPKTGESLVGKRNVPEMIALIHSELSEALEGYRKQLMDDHLPHRKMIEVELADTLVRVFDLAGHLNLDIGGAYIEKRVFNATREDHKLEVRQQGGKIC